MVDRDKLSSVDKPVDVAVTGVPTVKVDSDKPLPVILANERRSQPVDETKNLVAPPRTTAEENRHSAGQRDINRLWEWTQTVIALAVTTSALAISAYLAIYGVPDAQVAAFVFVYGVANLVIGFYFGRTNHQRVGGVELGR